MNNAIYAYKGFVYKVELDGLTIVDRYMEPSWACSLGGENVNKQRVGLSEWGEITLTEFKQIVDSYIDRNPV